MSLQGKAALGKLADLLERNGIDLEDVGRISKVSAWTGFYKDADGEAQTVDMAGIQFSPAWEQGPAWPVIQPAKPTVVKPLASTKRKTSTSSWKSAVVLPDPQIGYWRHVDTDTLDPFHDEAAMAIAVGIVADVNPDLIVLLGDVLDLPAWSRFTQEPAFAFTTQEAIDRTHLWLAELRANAPDARIVYIEGNHDRRLRKAIVDNAKEAFGLRQAATTPSTWPVMSIPHLLRLEELKVEYVDAYPAGVFWVNQNLACIHGEKLKPSQVVDDERVSIIQGHVHRIAMQHKTRRVFGGAKTMFAATPGCLCRVDGAVPSTKGSTDSFGRPVPRAEDWQQGLAVVQYEEGDGRFTYEQVCIFDGWARFRDKEYGGVETAA